MRKGSIESGESRLISERMKWKKEMLDLILVPAGLFLMFGYHIFLVYRYLRNYTCTVLGFHNHCQKVWVKKLMQVRLPTFPTLIIRCNRVREQE